MIEKERIIDFFNFCKIGEELYFYGRDDVGLCCLNLRSRYLEVNLLSEEVGGSAQFYKYTDCLEIGGRIYLAPYLGDKICIFNTDDRSFSFIDVGDKALAKKIIAYNEFLYFVCENNRILKLCLIDNKLERIDFGGKSNLYQDACLYKDKIYYPLPEKGSIAEFDLNSETMSHKKISDREVIFSTICVANDNLWLTGDSEFISKWNLTSNEIEYFELSLKRNKNIPWRSLFSGSLSIGDEIYMAPLGTDVVISIDVCSGAVRNVMEIPNDTISWSIHKFDDLLCICLSQIDIRPYDNMFFNTKGQTEKIYVANDLNNFIKQLESAEK